MMRVMLINTLSLSTEYGNSTKPDMCAKAGNKDRHGLGLILNLGLMKEFVKYFDFNQPKI